MRYWYNYLFDGKSVQIAFLRTKDWKHKQVHSKEAIGKTCKSHNQMNLKGCRYRQR